VYYTAAVMTRNYRIVISKFDREYFIEQKKGHNLLWLKLST